MLIPSWHSMCLCCFSDRPSEVPTFKLKSIHVLSSCSTSSSNVSNHQRRHYEKSALSAPASSKKGTFSSSALKSIATKFSMKTPSYQKSSFATSSFIKKSSSFKTYNKFTINVCNSPFMISSLKIQLSLSL